MSKQVNDENVGLLRQLVTTVQKKNDKEKVDNSIKMKPAKVIGIDEDTYKVFVYFIDDTEQNAYTFYNKSGEVLTEGDSVRVYYTTNPAKGWIGTRCGEPNIKELENAESPILPLTEYEYLTDLSAKLNGVTYTAEKDADTGLICKISDSNGNEFEPTINSGIADTAFHNAVFMAVAMCRGLKNISNDVLLYSGFDGSERYSGITGFTAIKNSHQKTSGISLRNQSDGTLALTFEKANSIYIDTGIYGDGNTDTIVIRSNEKINLTNYNKLRLTMNLGTNYTAGSFDGMLFFTTGTPEAAQKNVAYDFTDWELIASTTSGFSDYSNPGTFSDVDVDISALDGEHYLNFAVFHGTQQSQFSVYAFFKEIRLIQ